MQSDIVWFPESRLRYKSKQTFLCIFLDETLDSLKCKGQIIDVGRMMLDGARLQAMDFVETDKVLSTLSMFHRSSKMA